MPAPLPPQPAIDLTGELPALLSAADRAMGRLDGCVLTLPNADLFVFMYVRKEAVLSSQIEGTQSSLQDLLSAEAQVFDEHLPRDVHEVVNCVRATKHGLARLPDLPVSVQLIREIHAELMRGVRGGRLQPGELRTTQNWIGPAGCMLNTAAFVPPPHHAVPQAFTFLLTEAGVLHKPVLYLSHCFKQHRQSYCEHLQAVRDRGAWEAWLAFFLQGVISVAGEAAEMARRILQLREQHRAAITEHLGRAAGNGHKVLESLFDRPIVAVSDVQKMTGTTYAAANGLVSRLVKLNVLSEMTGYARNRRFRYAPYIALFNDSGPAKDSPDSSITSMQKRANRGGALCIKLLPIRRGECVLMRVLEIGLSCVMRLGLAPRRIEPITS